MKAQATSEKMSCIVNIINVITELLQWESNYIHYYLFTRISNLNTLLAIVYGAWTGCRRYILSSILLAF